MFSTLCSALLLFNGLVSSSALPRIIQPIPPSQDPWYKAPLDFESAIPGQVLRARVAPGNLTTVYKNASAAFNILFRTTDSHYEPTWAVTTVYIPSKPSGESLLSYQIPYNSPDVDYSPSYALYNPYYYASLVGTDISTALGHGWFVNVPDHEGPLASFTCGVQEGHTTLDSIRAILSLQSQLSMSKKPRVALWGYSGGSIASEFATELQVQYAPELEIAGAALGGLVPNLTSTVPHVTGSVFAGLLPLALLGLTSQYPAAHQYLLSELKQSGPYNATGFLSAKTMSFETAFAVLANQSIYDYFKNGANFIQGAPLQHALDRETMMGFHGTPQIPLYVYKAIHDEISPIADTDTLVSRYCEVGGNVIYERNSIGGHLAEETNGDARAIDWLAQVFAGTYQHSGCTIQDVAINVTSSPI